MSRKPEAVHSFQVLVQERWTQVPELLQNSFPSLNFVHFHPSCRGRYRMSLKFILRVAGQKFNLQVERSFPGPWLEDHILT